MLDKPLRKNYDYGEGLYQNMHDYKSVADFLKKKRKARRKKLLSHYNDINHVYDKKHYERGKEILENKLFDLGKELDLAKENNDVEKINSINLKIKSLLPTGSISLPTPRGVENGRIQAKKQQEYDNGSIARKNIYGILDVLSMAIDSKKSDEKKKILKQIMNKNYNFIDLPVQAATTLNEYVDSLILLKSDSSQENKINVKLIEIKLKQNYGVNLNDIISNMAMANIKELKNWELNILKYFKSYKSNVDVLSSLIRDGELINLEFKNQPISIKIGNVINMLLEQKSLLTKDIDEASDKNYIDFPLDQYLPEEYTGQSGLSGYSDKVNSDQYYTLPDEKVVKLREDGNPTHYIEGDPDLIPFLN